MQRVVTVALWARVAVGGAALGRLALPAEGLRGHYFTNLTRSGQQVAIAIDRSLSTDTLDNGTAGIYQTGFSDMLFENRVELEDGAAFLEKPFTARGLREAVRLVLFGSINP